MTQNTINKIVENSELGKKTIIGKYTYMANFYVGKIVRCRTEDADREWIDDFGRIRSGWECICKF